MSREFYLHVGLQRCASTLIENTFLAPGHDVSAALRGGGILPLLDLHLHLRDHREDVHWTGEFVDQLRRRYVMPQTGNAAWRGFFLTEEGLSASWLAGGPGIDIKARAGHLAALLEGFDVRILLLVRDQASFVRSLYALHLQNGGTQGFAEFVGGIPLSALDWLDIARTYQGAFGQGNVHVIPYNAECYRLGSPPYPGFLSALQGAMGISDPVEVPRNHLFNPSIKTNLLPLQLAANKVLAPPLAREVSSLLRSGVTEPVRVIQSVRQNRGREEAASVRAALAVEPVKQATEEAMPFSAEEQRAYLANFNAGNRDLFAQFMADYDASAFLAA